MINMYFTSVIKFSEFNQLFVITTYDNTTIRRFDIVFIIKPFIVVWSKPNIGDSDITIIGIKGWYELLKLDGIL